jgi:hypothetical protein
MVSGTLGLATPVRAGQPSRASSRRCFIASRRDETRCGIGSSNGSGQHERQWDCEQGFEWEVRMRRFELKEFK